MPEPDREGQFLPLRWHIPDTVVSRHATNIVVQRTAHPDKSPGQPECQGYGCPHIGEKATS